MEISSLNRRELIDKLTAVYQLSRRYDQAYRDLYIIQQKKLPPEEAKIIPKLQGRFGGGGGVMLSSDIQEEEYEIIYKSGAAIGEPQDSFAIEPGMGCYLTASFKKDLLNGYAVDINEVVTINFPVRVDNIWDDDIFDSEPSYDAVEGETYVLTFTRDQLVN